MWYLGYIHAWATNRDGMPLGMSISDILSLGSITLLLLVGSNFIF